MFLPPTDSADIAAWTPLAAAVASDFPDWCNRFELENIALEACWRDSERLAAILSDSHRVNSARQTMRWRIIDALRRMGPEPFAPLPLDIEAPERRECGFDMEWWLRRLPHRTTLERIAAGMSVTEIAEEDGVTQTAVSHRLIVARRVARQIKNEEQPKLPPE